MRFMLDTNICIYVIKKKPVHVLNKFKSLAVSDIGISTITLAELVYGADNSSFPSQNFEALFEFSDPLEIAPFDEQAAISYGKIRTYLQRKGTLISAMDMLIAAHAKSLSITLVTNNVREFSRVPDLKVENWVEC